MFIHTLLFGGHIRLKPSYTRNLADTELTIESDGESQTVKGRMLYEFNFPAAKLR